MADDIPGPEPGLEAASTSDFRALAEERKFARLDELEDSHHQIRLLAVKHWGRILVWFMYGFAVAFAIALAVLFWHYLMPANPPNVVCWSRLPDGGERVWCYQWLSEAQIHKIQSILFSGGIGAFLSGVAQRYFGQAERSEKP